MLCFATLLGLRNVLPRMLPHIPDIPKNTPYIPLANDGYLQDVVCVCAFYRLSAN